MHVGTLILLNLLIKWLIILILNFISNFLTKYKSPLDEIKKKHYVY